MIGSYKCTLSYLDTIAKYEHCRDIGHCMDIAADTLSKLRTNMDTSGKFGRSGNFSSWLVHRNLFGQLLVKLCHAHARLHSPLLRHMGRCYTALQTLHYITLQTLQTLLRHMGCCYVALQCHTLKSINICNERWSRRLDEFNVIGHNMI